MKRIFICIIAFLFIAMISEGARVKFCLFNEKLCLEIFNDSQENVDFRTFSYIFKDFGFIAVDQIIIAISPEGEIYFNGTRVKSPDLNGRIIVSKRQNIILPNVTKLRSVVGKEVYNGFYLPGGVFHIFTVLREFNNDKFELHIIGPVKIQVGNDRSILSMKNALIEDIPKQSQKFISAMSDDLKKNVQNLSVYYRGK